MDVKICGMRLLKRPKEFDDGGRMLAYFDARYAGILFSGCTLVKTPKLGFRVGLPKLPGYEGQVRSLVIEDDLLRNRLMESARQVYRNFGGTEGEWASQAMHAGTSEENPA